MSAPAEQTAPAQTQTPRSNRPIFVVACARSGTTLLQLMLHSHHRIAIPPETRFLMSMYDKRAEFGNLKKKANRKKLAKWITKRRASKFHDLGLDADEVGQAIVDGPPTIGSAAGIVFKAYAARHGKQRWGDKRPMYIIQLDRLTKLFPDAQIVHIIRDGRDCVSSLKRMSWWKGGSIAAIWYWREAMRSGARARKKYSSDQYYEFYYESLVSDPEKELRKLCNFLGEEFDEAMLEPHRIAGEAVPERKTHHERTHKPVDTKAIAQWKEQLEPWEIKLMELVARRELKAHGYKPSTALPVPPPKRLMSFVKYSRARKLRETQADARDAKIAQKYKQPVKSKLKSTV